VRLVGRDDDDGATGIEVLYGKTLCQTTPPNHRSLLLEHNLVVGPGRDTPQHGDDYTGIQTDWVCGSMDRDIDILRNLVAGFKFAGMDLEQTADVQVSCNFLWSNQRGVDVYRDSEPTGASIRFRNNKLEATESRADLFALRTTDASKVKLGPAQGDRGTNRLKVAVDSTKFIFETDSNPSHVLDASNNFWYADTLLKVASEITGRIVSADSTYTITGFGTDDSNPPANCWPDTSLAASLLSGSSAQRGLAAAQGDLALVASNPGMPTVLELGRPYPNPNRSGATLSLAVPESRVGQ
jgi:hypothetical protein